MKIFYNNGHYILDSGAWHSPQTENKMTVELGNILKPLLKESNIEHVYVPDNINLKQSIDWVNARADINDIAISTHFNANVDKNVAGTEAYYYNDREKKMGDIFTKKISSALKTKNNGAIEDKYTWVGSLGWVRKLKCDSVLIEICYLTNKNDMSLYTPEKASQGIIEALLEIIPRKVPNKVNSNIHTDLEYKKQISNLMAIIDRLVRIINKLLGN